MNKFISIFIITSLVCLLSSCAIYKENFDCPPCPGVPCTSVTDLEAMIIETPDGGPDIFTGERPNVIFPYRTCRPISLKKRQKLWVCDRLTTEGNLIRGHYIYLTDLNKKDIDCPEYNQEWSY